MAEINTRQFGDSLFREIHKNSWLTRYTNKDPRKKKERVWTVFCVHDDVEAYLETYLDCKAAVSHKPDQFIALNDTKHVSPTICPRDQEFEFVINLTTDVVRLAAPTWELMLDWVESIRGKLFELRILSPRENLYSKLPEPRSAPLLPTRDPTSPLPLPPLAAVPLPPGVEPLQVSESSTSRSHPFLQRGMSLPERTDACSLEATSINVNNYQMGEIFRFDLSDIGDALHSNSNLNLPPGESAHYEPVFQIRQSPGPSNRQVRVQRSNSSPRRLQPPPQPYRTLREQQVLELQKEIKHPAGVRLQIRKKDCISSIALGHAFGGV